MKTIKIVFLILYITCSTKLFSQVWDNMDGGFTGTDSFNLQNTTSGLRKIIPYNNKIIVTGHFLNASNTVLSNTAQWDGVHWQSMGVGIWSEISYPTAYGLNLVDYNNKVYVMGSFEGVAGAYHYDTTHYASRISKWDGLDWQPLTPPDPGPVYSGFNSIATSATVYHNNLYIGGGFSYAFDSSGLHPAFGMARWNDTVFSNCGTFFSNNSSGNFHQRAGVVYNNKLIVGGFFNSIDSSPFGYYGYVAAYNDTVWSTLSTGLNNTVYALTVFNGELFAGGCFTATGSSVPVNYVSKWDGIQWLPVGEGLNDTVWSLSVDSVNNKLIAGGAFTQTGLGLTAKHLAEWNGTNWVEVGGGADDIVTAIYAKDSNLYIGGYFTHVGNGIPANAIARWGPSHVGVDDISASSTTMQLEIYPNPSNGEFTI